MSPEIRIGGRLVADIPDTTGWYLTDNGSPMYVDLDAIDARKKKQLVIIDSTIIGGLRIVGLTLDGRGSSSKIRKGGDGKNPVIDVTLHDRPIRVAYSPRLRGSEQLIVPRNGHPYIVYERGDRRRVFNPRWIQGHGRR